LRSAREAMALVAKGCDEIVKAANLAELVDAICAQEGVPALTMDVLKNLGVGGASGVRLLDCRGAEEKARYRKAYAVELVARDRRLSKITPSLGAGMAKARAANSLKELMRRLAGLCEKLKKEEEGDVVAAQNGTLIVLTQSEEDSDMMLAGFDAATVKKQRELLRDMYNCRMQPHEMATVSQLRAGARGGGAGGQDQAVGRMRSIGRGKRSCSRLQPGCSRDGGLRRRRWEGIWTMLAERAESVE
jgi:hypothetical protein